MLEINESLCIGCGNCIDSCPVGAISLEDGKAVIKAEKCRLCGLCQQICPVGAIREMAGVSGSLRPRGSLPGSYSRRGVGMLPFAPGFTNRTELAAVEAGYSHSFHRLWLSNRYGLRGRFGPLHRRSCGWRGGRGGYGKRCGWI